MTAFRKRPLPSTRCAAAVVWLGIAISCLAGTVDFDRDIQPILSENCYQCHGPDAGSRKAKLRLDRKEGALGKSEDGRAVVSPGNPRESELITRILSADPEEVMPTPKSHKKLSATQKQLLMQWVEQGAVWGRHWAFVTPKRPPLPELADYEARLSELEKKDAPRAAELREQAETWGKWARNPIDHFVLSRLLSEGLTPSPEAAPEKFCRRVYLDLTGIPPAPQELDAFLQSATRNPQSAIEALVDHLLASPRFGERMVWEWLDAARYADTNGYQGDPTRSMWYWRDWAIKALNENMPFDQFTVEQIAGDLLPNPDETQVEPARATFSIPASWIPETGRGQLIATGFHRNHMINGEGGRIAEESRVDYVQDRVETTATVWMGLTMNCCRCHDHKFDPILQREYYQLSAYFNSIDETGANDAGGLAKPIISLPSAGEQKHIDDLRAREAAAAKEYAELEKKLRASQAEWEQATLGGEDMLAEPVWRLLAPHEMPGDRGAQLTLQGDGNTLQHTPEGSKPSASPDNPALLRPLPDRIRELLKKTPEMRAQVEKEELTKYYLDTNSQLTSAREHRLNAVKARENAEKQVPRTMVMRERATPRETHILVKGAYDNYAEKVGFGVPAALPPMAPDAPQNRLGLAQWLVSPENPLTARVTVNRYWQMFFGQGIVKTTEDFGVQGEKPTHPRLLDWLAREFVDTGWDVKHILRLIVTSATYRQQSNIPEGMEERDPENKLLARGPRFRLPSWMLRDQALAVSGLLVEKLGGPPVKTYQPVNVWEDATFGQIKFSQDHGESLYRRSLYVFWRRIVGPTLFFDVANRQQCMVRVARTNTPLHALITLNDVTYVEAARALGERMLKEGGGTDAERLAYGFRLCTSRMPDASEAALLARSLARFREEYSQDADAAQKLISTGESNPDGRIPAPELAAHAGAGLLLLNLDETLCKE